MQNILHSLTALSQERAAGKADIFAKLDELLDCLSAAETSLREARRDGSESARGNGGGTCRRVTADLKDAAQRLDLLQTTRQANRAFSGKLSDLSNSIDAKFPMPASKKGYYSAISASFGGSSSAQAGEPTMTTSNEEAPPHHRSTAADEGSSCLPSSSSSSPPHPPPSIESVLTSLIQLHLLHCGQIRVFEAFMEEVSSGSFPLQVAPLPKQLVDAYRQLHNVTKPAE
eukprot:GHVU01137746.1.p1 GENE.GHVU01137746.1~~GHVU01137746.1.p1  ORF type:complete len:229 (-),score=38.05 GHVU01137746.1:83-769(-)